QMVRDLREHGEKNAYYYHGSEISSVCIGAWPHEAVDDPGTGIDMNTGKTRYDAHSVDPTQTLYVVNDKTDKLDTDFRDENGRRMLVTAPKFTIVDPTLKKAAEKYPYHSVNYDLHAIKGSDGG